MSKPTNDLALVLGAHAKSIKATLPKFGDAFEARVNELQRESAMVLEKLDAIRSSGRYSPDGERKERRLAVYGFVEALSAVRAATVGKLQKQRDEQRVAALKPKTISDPATALVNELRAQEVRQHLRGLDPLTLLSRIKQDDGTGLLDAIESDPVAAAGGPSIAPRDVIEEARLRIAEQNNPALGELATLEKAYEFALGSAEQIVLAASGLSKLEATTDPAPAPKDARQPVLVSTGEAVKL